MKKMDCNVDMQVAALRGCFSLAMQMPVRVSLAELQRFPFATDNWTLRSKNISFLALPLKQMSS